MKNIAFEALFETDLLQVFLMHFQSEMEILHEFYKRMETDFHHFPTTSSNDIRACINTLKEINKT